MSTPRSNDRISPDVFRFHDEATLLTGRVPRGRVGYRNGGSVGAEGCQNTVGGLYRQAESAVCGKIGLAITGRR